MPEGGVHQTDRRAVVLFPMDARLGLMGQALARRTDDFMPRAQPPSPGAPMSENHCDSLMLVTNVCVVLLSGRSARLARSACGDLQSTKSLSPDHRWRIRF
jgi:hypothetical protein